MFSEFEARLGYIASSRLSWATQSCLKGGHGLGWESRQQWETNAHDIVPNGKWSEGANSPTTEGLDSTEHYNGMLSTGIRCPEIQAFGGHISNATHNTHTRVHINIKVYMGHYRC